MNTATSISLKSLNDRFASDPRDAFKTIQAIHGRLTRQPNVGIQVALAIEALVQGQAESQVSYGLIGADDFFPKKHVAIRPTGSKKPAVLSVSRVSQAFVQKPENMTALSTSFHKPMNTGIQGANGSIDWRNSNVLKGEYDPPVLANLLLADLELPNGHNIQLGPTIEVDGKTYTIQCVNMTAEGANVLLHVLADGTIFDFAFEPTYRASGQPKFRFAKQVMKDEQGRVGDFVSYTTPQGKVVIVYLTYDAIYENHKVLSTQTGFGFRTISIDEVTQRITTTTHDGIVLPVQINKDGQCQQPTRLETLPSWFSMQPQREEQPLNLLALSASEAGQDKVAVQGWFLHEGHQLVHRSQIVPAS